MIGFSERKVGVYPKLFYINLIIYHQILQWLIQCINNKKRTETRPPCSKVNNFLHF